MTATACAECRTLLGGYVLNALEPGEVETVRRHLAECSACAEEHGQLAGIPAILDTAGTDEAPAEHPPAALEEAVLDRFAREHHRPAVAIERRPGLAARVRGLLKPFARPLPAAFAGAVAAAVVTIAVIALPGNQASAEQYRASLAGSSAAPGASGSANLKVLESGTFVRLHVRGLRGGPGAVYELWCIRNDGRKVSAGTFRTDAAGRADVQLTTAAVPGEYEHLGIERHPGVRVMAGDIQFPRS